MLEKGFKTRHKMAQPTSQDKQPRVKTNTFPTTIKIYYCIINYIML